MTWAPTETQKTVYSILTSDEDLAALLGGTCRVFDRVPDNAPFPYLTMQIKPWTDRGNHTFEGLACELTIHAWYRENGETRGRGDLEVQKIQKRIDELLHSTDPCVDGWDIVGLRRSFIDILKDPDNVTLHGVQKFKLMIGEN